MIMPRRRTGGTRTAATRSQTARQLVRRGQARRVIAAGPGADSS